MSDPIRALALQLLWEMYREVDGDIEQPVLPDRVAQEAGIIDPSWLDYNEIYSATLDYLEREGLAHEAVELTWRIAGAVYYRITPAGEAMLRQEGYL